LQDDAMILSNTTNVVFAAGQPGLLFPAIPVADELRRLMPQVRAVFVGAGGVAEFRQISAAGYEYCSLGVPSDSGRPAGVLQRLWSGGVERSFVRRCRPAAVVWMGGTLGGGLGRAAVRQRIPLILFEIEARVGGETQRLAPLADLVFTAFDQARDALASSCPVRVIGIPARRRVCSGELLDSPPGNGRAAANRRRLVILADGQPNGSLNTAVSQALVQLRPLLGEWLVVHQAPARDIRPLRRTYYRSKIDAVVTTNVHRLGMLLSRADLIVAAPTPSSVGEVAAATSATILTTGSGEIGRRLSLATAMRDSGACVSVADTASGAIWANSLNPLLSSEDRRRSLADAKQRFFRADAAWHMATAIRDLASRD